VVIPCLNEAGTIGVLVAAVREHAPWVVVADNGSTDATSVLAREPGATVVEHAANRGKGAALRTGLSLARNRGFEWAFTLDLRGAGGAVPRGLSQGGAKCALHLRCAPLPGTPRNRNPLFRAGSWPLL